MKPHHRRISRLIILGLVLFVLIPVLAQSFQTVPESIAGVSAAVFTALLVAVACTLLYSSGKLLSHLSTVRGRVAEVRAKLIGNCLLSYAFLLYGFAVFYVLESRARPNSFNVGSLDFFTACYFSVVTAATVGFGDIVPQSTPARAAVMLEIVITFIYGIFVLSALAGLLTRRQK